MVGNRRLASIGLVLLLAGCMSPGQDRSDKGVQQPDLGALPVVVATYDSGLNPFHPCFRRDEAQDSVALAARRGIPVEILHLTFGDTFDASLQASQSAINAMKSKTVYAVEHTNLLFIGFDDPIQEFLDSSEHGSEASSQIVCADYGAAPEAFLLEITGQHIQLDYNEGTPQAPLFAWVSQQPWIDIFHPNTTDDAALCNSIENSQALEGPVLDILRNGKMIVWATGNERYPSELHCTHGISPGILIVGADDNEGYNTGPAKDPHIVMDGVLTWGISSKSFDQPHYFSLTSSSSPRTAGYVAHLLGMVRSAACVTEPTLGSVATWQCSQPAPQAGPFTDGNLTVLEFHEVIRKTANPLAHPSRFDGDSACTPEGRIEWNIAQSWGDATCIPQTTTDPNINYPFMGYGEVSEHTWDHALNVTLGHETMPSRPGEDAAFARSNQLRGITWPS